ncbi:MAG: hypothetical protein ABMA15_23080 [Vicinamibacterales bacterium]
MTMHSRQSRRSFISALTSVAGVAAIDVAASPAAAQSSSAASAAAPAWDLKWMDDLKAKHRQVFDLGEVNLVADPRPLRFPRNYLDAFHDVFALDFPEVKTIVGISGTAFGINASDRLWEKYALGERSKIMDPATKQPAIRNVFLNEESLGVKALQARGTIFWQCNIALNNIAQQLATARQLAVADVRADLLAGLNPGVRLVPSHVMAMGMVQERGVTYVRI